MKCVTQEHQLGCGVACVAAVLGMTYAEALGLFTRKDAAWTQGYFCRDIVSALGRAGKPYSWAKAGQLPAATRNTSGAIVFVEKGISYPSGHYLLRTPKGWMNSWVNFPLIASAKSGYQRRLPGKAAYIIFPVDHGDRRKRPEKLSQLS